MFLEQCILQDFILLWHCKLALHFSGILRHVNW